MDAGQSTYLVSAQYFLMAGGWPAAQRDAILKGKQYCRKEQFTLFGETRSGTPGFTPLTSEIKFTCRPDVTAENDAACNKDLQSPELDRIRGKVELRLVNVDVPPPFEIAANDTFPTPSERAAIATWAKLRDDCLNRTRAAALVPAAANPLQTVFIQQDQSFLNEAEARVSELVLALYRAKLTYGEFANKRYEIIRDALFSERQFRMAGLLADRDRQMQAQQLAEQQFQSRLATWSAFVQAVNARQPQVVHINGAVRLQTRCSSQQVGSFGETTCN